MIIVFNVYHTMPETLKKVFVNIVGKRKTAVNQHFPLSTMFFTSFTSYVYKGSISYHSKVMANVNVFFVDKPTGKNYKPPIYPCRAMKISPFPTMSSQSSLSTDISYVVCKDFQFRLVPFKLFIKMGRIIHYP